MFSAMLLINPCPGFLVEFGDVFGNLCLALIAMIAFDAMSSAYLYCF